MNKVLCVLSIGLGMCISAQTANRATICRVNHKRVQAMSRNDRIGSEDVNYKRCVYLYNATKNMREPARSYQMRKLRASGC